MMGVMATQNQSLDGDTIELLMVDYGIEAKKKVEVDTADIERFFVEEGYQPRCLGRASASCYHHGTR